MSKLIQLPKIKRKQSLPPSLHQRNIAFEEASSICNHFDEQSHLGNGSFGFGQVSISSTFYMHVFVQVFAQLFTTYVLAL